MYLSLIKTIFMKKLAASLLIVNDDDLKCKTEGVSLSSLNTSHLNFLENDLNKFDIIVYQGSKGCKILKNKFFRTGKIG